MPRTRRKLFIYLSCRRAIRFRRVEWHFSEHLALSSDDFFPRSLRIFFFFRFFSANLTVYVSSHVFNARSREVIKLLCQKFRPTFFPRPSLKVNAVLKTNSYALRILCYNFYCVTQYNYFGLTKLSPSHSLSTSRSLSSARARATPLVFSTFLLHIRRTRRVSESFRERTLSNR